jgi:hypothetical protein
MRHLLAVTLLLLTATAGGAQQPSTSWSPVRQLTPGQSIRAVVDSGVTHRGAFQSADDDFLTLLIDNRALRLPRAGVRDVSVAGTSRRRNVWWGLAIGAAVSVAAISVQCHGEDPSCNEGSPALFYPITGAGAAIGALMPPRTTWREIYAK